MNFRASLGKLILDLDDTRILQLIFSEISISMFG
jgi:hypothetical protein